ncbi:MAG: hypothetical protein NTW86_25190 [Candidatus Sumerlaeota bacterium]|nr:hypothetical protein [Candidatus Sumerlaeota bacterium]
MPDNIEQDDISIGVETPGSPENLRKRSILLGGTSAPRDDLTFKTSELIEGGETRVKKGYGAFLREMWAMAAEAVGAPTDPGDNAFFAAVEREFSPDYFFVPDTKRRAPKEFQGDSGKADAREEKERKEDEEGFDGPISDVALRVVIGAQSFGEDRRTLREFLTGRVAATLARLESQRQGSPENHVDIVLPVLIERRPTSCSPVFRAFVAGLRGYLGRQPDSERTPSFYITQSGLGDVLIEANGRECLAQALYYYHETLSQIVRTMKQPAEPFSADIKRIVGKCANNSANGLDELALHFGGSKGETGAREVRRTLKIISAANSDATSDPPPEGFDRATTIMVHWVGTEPQSVWATILDDMMRSSRVWEEPGDAGTLKLAYWEAAAACVRVAMSTRRKDAPSAFFNSGLSLLRAFREPGAQNRQNLVRARVILNSMGLFWALEADISQPRVAMVDNDGLSCAVNLLGACTDMAWEDTRGRNALQGVVNRLFEMESLLQDQGVDFFRMKNSLRDLKVTPKLAQNQGDPAALESCVGELVSYILAQMPRPKRAASLSKQTPEVEILDSNDIVWGLFSVILDGAALGEFQASLVKVLRQIADQMKDPRQALLNLYGPMAATVPGEPGVGPIVQAGLMTQDEWNKIAHEAVDESATSLAALLRSDLLGWLERGGAAS